MTHAESPGGDGIPIGTMPLTRSICWRPLGDSYHLLAAVLGDRTTHHPLFVTQPALREIEEQRLAISGDLPVAGLLGGTLARSAERGIIYITVTRVVPLPSMEPGEPGRPAFREAVDRIAAHLAVCGEEIIGWYRSRARVGRRLLSGDERLMLEHFPEPWQTTLIFSADGGGSFFRYKLEAERSFAIPFYELMEESVPVTADQSVLPFNGYERMARAAYPEISGIALEDALRTESEEELGSLGRRLLAQLRRAWGESGTGNQESGIGYSPSGNGAEKKRNGKNSRF